MNDDTIQNVGYMTETLVGPIQPVLIVNNTTTLLIRTFDHWY